MKGEAADLKQWLKHIFYIPKHQKPTDDAVDVSSANGQYTLTSGECTVTLKAVGNASTGYCKIFINGIPYYTLQLSHPKEQNPAEFTFDVNVSEDTQMTVIPTW